MWRKCSINSRVKELKGIIRGMEHKRIRVIHQGTDIISNIKDSRRNLATQISCSTHKQESSSSRWALEGQGTKWGKCMEASNEAISKAGTVDNAHEFINCDHVT